MNKYSNIKIYNYVYNIFTSGDIDYNFLAREASLALSIENSRERQIHISIFMKKNFIQLRLLWCNGDISGKS